MTHTCCYGNRRQTGAQRAWGTPACSFSARLTPGPRAEAASREDSAGQRHAPRGPALGTVARSGRASAHPGRYPMVPSRQGDRFRPLSQRDSSENRLRVASRPQPGRCPGQATSARWCGMLRAAQSKRCCMLEHQNYEDSLLLFNLRNVVSHDPLTLGTSRPFRHNPIL